MPLVAGVDSSTQATKVVVVDASTGSVLREGRAAHPDGTEVDPNAWWQAFEEASAGLLDDVDAISFGGQQHGMVLLDDDGLVVRPALLWNDTRSAPSADALSAELGGAAAWASQIGTALVAAITVTKLRWVADHEPDNAARAVSVLLPHDWLTWRLLGRTTEAMVTDRGEASGTGYWSSVEEVWRPDLLKLAFGRTLQVPRVLGPAEPAGVVPERGGRDLLVGPGTGDNMAAALGVQARPGDVVVSVGTSGTVFGPFAHPTTDPRGYVAGFADATGAYLPLVCTLNAARVLVAGAQLLGVDLDELSRLALSAPPGASGLVLLPYLEGERTPNRPGAKGRLGGLNLANASRAGLARAFVEGMVCGLADGLDALRDTGLEPQRVLLVGGAARSPAVQQIASAVFGLPVLVPADAEYVALGAARQAAWTLQGGPTPPEWPVDPVRTVEVEPTPAVREAYAELRDHPEAG